MTGNYWEISIETADNTIREELIAQMSEWGFDGFEEDEKSLNAFIAEEFLVEKELINLLNNYNVKYNKSIIYKQNWNEVWESNFDPVTVDNFVHVRAIFHAPLPDIQHEIIITPKMSFGTGHHATTYMVIQLMRSLNLAGTSVYDFGTGTGILAILAEKLGAENILAVDNDDWCIENATENAEINGAHRIRIEKADNPQIYPPVDKILANINKHILQAHMPALSSGLVVGGNLILSGLLQEDEADIQNTCQSIGLEHITTIEKNGWIALLYQKGTMEVC
jgi:ribosomal protein L11 methyltransferase